MDGTPWKLARSPSGRPWVHYDAGGDREATGSDVWAAERIAELEAALRAIFLAADNAGTEQEWADMVSAEMTDERRALVTKPD